MASSMREKSGRPHGIIGEDASLLHWPTGGSDYIPQLMLRLLVASLNRTTFAKTRALIHSVPLFSHRQPAPLPRAFTSSSFAAMPTIGVKRDALFERLGRSYSGWRCNSRLASCLGAPAPQSRLNIRALGDWHAARTHTLALRCQAAT
jgi:hypothetical protein